MLIKIPSRSDCSESEVTSETLYLSRRRLLGASFAGLALASGLPRLGFADEQRYAGVESVPAPGWFAEKLPQTRWQAVNVQGEAITPFKDATHYNNFYEFGPNKGDPAENASALKAEPWSVVIDGEVGKPGTYALEDFVKPYQLEERIYRLRCVEAWSMVIPWLGFPLADLLKRVEPNGQAKFVRFETLQRPEQMVGQRSGFSVIDWPYMEGFRCPPQSCRRRWLVSGAGDRKSVV